MTLEIIADLAPATKQTGTQLSGDIKVLDAFSGFNNFYEHRIRPAILTWPPKNISIVFFGEAGVGKETLAAMLLKKVKTDDEILEWQNSANLELRAFYLSWANTLNRAKEIEGQDYNGKIRPVIVPHKKHGEYSRYDLANSASLMKHSLLESRRNYHTPCLFIVELLGVVPDDFSAEIMGIVPKNPRPVDIGFSVMRTLARLDNTFFIGVVTDDKVQKRATALRKALSSDPSQPDIATILNKHKNRVDKIITGDVAGFTSKMGTAEAIEYVRSLVNREIFYLSRRGDSFKKREEMIRNLNFNIPDDLQDLEGLLDAKKYPGRRSKILAGYFKNYLMEEVLNIGQESVFIQENYFIKDDIDLYRQLLESSSLPMPDRWKRKWGLIHSR